MNIFVIGLRCPPLYSYVKSFMALWANYGVLSLFVRKLHDSVTMAALSITGSFAVANTVPLKCEPIADRIPHLQEYLIFASAAVMLFRHGAVKTKYQHRQRENVQNHGMKERVHKCEDHPQYKQTNIQFINAISAIHKGHEFLLKIVHFCTFFRNDLFELYSFMCKS